MYACKIRVWSAIGFTPVTKREGAYCDVLADIETHVATPVAARELTSKLIKIIPGAVSGHFQLDEAWPNQNTRHDFVR
jgi:hypothetical protein